MSCKNILKDTVPLEEGRELFSQKKFGGSSKTYRTAKKHAMRIELLRLQKTSFFEATSSSRGGIYYKCFLKIVTKFGGVIYPSYSNNPCYARKTPPSSIATRLNPPPL